MFFATTFPCEVLLSRCLQLCRFSSRCPSAARHCCKLRNPLVCTLTTGAAGHAHVIDHHRQQQQRIKPQHQSTTKAVWSRFSCTLCSEGSRPLHTCHCGLGRLHVLRTKCFVECHCSLSLWCVCVSCRTCRVANGGRTVHCHVWQKMRCFTISALFACVTEFVTQAETQGSVRLHNIIGKSTQSQ